MKKIFLGLILTLFALSVSATQYCETVITGVNANHQAKITCQSLGGNRYEFVFESVDPFTGYNAGGSNFHANGINGTEGQQVSAHLVQDGNKLTWTVESTTVPNIYVGDFYVNYSDGEEHYNIPTDEDFSLECSDTRDYVITAYVPDGNAAPNIHFWGEDFDPGTYPTMQSNGYPNTYVYTITDAPRSGIQVLFDYNYKHTADQAKITDDACYNVYWDGDVYTATPTSCHEMRDVKITVNATSQPSLYYWGMPNGGITYDAPIVMPAKVGVPSGWYEYTIENVDALSGVNYLIRMESNGKTTDQNTKANVVKNAIYHGDWGDHKVELTDASYPQYYSNLTLTSSTSLDLFAGNTSQITYTTSSTGAFTYHSDAEEVATVSASGLITAVAAGTAHITLSQAADANYLASEEKTITVTVTADPSYPSEKGFGTYQGLNLPLYDIRDNFARKEDACGHLDLYVVTFGDNILYKAVAKDGKIFGGPDYASQLRIYQLNRTGMSEHWAKEKSGDNTTRWTAVGATNNPSLSAYGDEFLMNTYSDVCGARTIDAITYRRDYINNPISDDVAPVLTSAAAEEVGDNMVITLSEVTTEEVFYMIKDAEHNATHISLVPTFTLPKDGSGITYNYSCYAVDFNGNMSVARQVQITMPFDENTNLALRKTVYKSAQANNNDMVATNANDGNTGTRWSSGAVAQDSDAWWAVDLGADYSLTDIKIYWEGAFASNFTIKAASTMPTNWADDEDANWLSTIVTSTTNPTAGQFTTYPVASESHGRYLRIRANTLANNGWGMSFFEFEVYGSGLYGASGQLDAPTNVNVTDGTLTFDEVPNATSYEAYVYDGVTKVHTQDVVPAGTALTYVPASNKTLTVKVVAKGAGYLNSDESDAVNWEFNNYLATPTISSLTAATGVITFANVANASSYTAKIYYGGELIATYENVNSGDALTRPAVRNNAYEVKLIAIGTAPYITSEESVGVDWYIAGTPRLNEPSRYCAKEMLSTGGNWVDDATSAALFTWETMNDGSVVITISPKDAVEQNQTEFRLGAMTAANFHVGDPAHDNLETYFERSFDAVNNPTQVILTPKSVLAYGTKIYYGTPTNAAQIEYRTQSVGGNNDLYPNFYFEYTYGTYCNGEYVFVSTDVNNGEWGAASAQQNDVDVTYAAIGSEVTFVAAPADGFVFENWTDATGSVVSANARYTINSLSEDIALTANFDYARTIFCQTEILSNGGAHTGKKLYMTLGYNPTSEKYYILYEGSEEAKLTSINTANYVINNVNSGYASGINVPFTVGGAEDHGLWHFEAADNGSAWIEFDIADGSTWRDIYVWSHSVYFFIDGAVGDCGYTSFPERNSIDWSHSCADTEAPELEEPKYDVLSETSVRLSLKATDDRDFIRYTISGFDGDPIVINATSGVREYYIVTDMEPNYPYRVTVVAADKAGNTDSKIITVTAIPDATAPFNFVASALSLSTNAIQITASADEDRASDITYVIYDNDNNRLGSVFAAPGEKIIYKVNGLDPNTAYTFKVVAQNFNYVSTEEIVVSATTHNVDLALNKSSQAGQHEGSVAFGSVEANDGNYGSRWGSEGGTHPDQDWWSVDLGADYNIENIRILWETACAKYYSLYISDNGTSWTEIGSYDEQPTHSSGTAQTDGYFMDYNDFSHRAKGRYLKVAATSTVGGYNNLNNGISMWAFEVYGYPAVASDARIMTHEVVSVSSNQAVLDLTITSTHAIDYIMVSDAAKGINVRCNPTMVDDKYRITIPGLTANETYNFTLVAFDTQHGESPAYSVAPAIKALATRPVIGPAPVPPFRNGRDFRSIYSDFYKPALKNQDTFSRTKWIDVFCEEEDVNDDHHLLYGYNGHNREAVWGDTGGAESFLARSGDSSDPIFPLLNYTDGVHTGLDIHNYTKLHIDLWADQAMTNFTVRLGDEILVEHLAHGGAGWQSYDIDVPAGKRVSDLRFMKFQGITGDYWALDNVYFYNPVDYSTLFEVRVKANLKEAGIPVIVGTDNEDVYFAALDEHLRFEAHSAEAQGFFFVNWTDDDDNDAEKATTEPIDVIITGPTHYTANYIRKYKVVGVAKEIDSQKTGDVTVVLSDASPSVVDGFNFVTPGTNATFTATQNSPYTFKYWALDGKFYSAGADDGSHTVVYENIQRDIELRAIYDKDGEVYNSTEINTGYNSTVNQDGQLRVSYYKVGHNAVSGNDIFRILIEGTEDCNITAAYNNFNFYVHNVEGGRDGEGKSFPASEWNEHTFPYGYGYTYVDFEAADANLIKIDADRNYVVFYRNPNHPDNDKSHRDLVECKLPAMGINWHNEAHPAYPMKFTGGNWSDAANWSNTEGNGTTLGLPDDDTDVFLLGPTTVDIATARAKSVTIYSDFTNGLFTGYGQLGWGDRTETHTGHLSINADAALQVVNKVQKVEDVNFYARHATAPEDLFIASAVGGNGALIQGDMEGETGATVQMYSKAHGTDDGKGNVSNAVWQWMTTPLISSGDVLGSYYGSWMFQYVNEHHGWTHQMVNGSIMSSFDAYAITSGSPRTYTLEGTLAATANPAYSYEFANTVDDNLTDPDFLTNKGGVQMPTVRGINMFGNSWTAPINIAAFHPSDFEGATKSIILFNTGLDVDGTKASSYVTVPIKSAGSMARDCQVIPSMQAFQVDATSNGRLTLDYNRLVRTEAGTGVNIQPMRAPGRAAAVEEENENGIDEKLRIWVKGSRYSDFLYLFRNEETTNGFDDGWDGRKIMSDNWDIPVLTVYSEQRHWQVSTQPQLAGTQLGFLQGEDTEYTFEFEYEGEEELWLYDGETNIYTAIETGNTYRFTSSTYALQTRFIITTREQPDDKPGIATGVDNQEQMESVTRKVLLNDNMYILNNGCLYDATGKMVR